RQAARRARGRAGNGAAGRPPAAPRLALAPPPGAPGQSGASAHPLPLASVTPPSVPALPAAAAPIARRAALPNTPPAITGPVPVAALYRPTTPRYQPNAPSPASIDMLATTRVPVPERVLGRRRFGRSGREMPAKEVEVLETVQMPYQPQSQTSAPPRGTLRALGVAGRTVERFASLLLFAAILVLVGTIIAAAVSPNVDHAIRSVIHVDIRETLGRFGDAMQQLLKRIRHE